MQREVAKDMLQRFMSLPQGEFDEALRSLIGMDIDGWLQRHPEVLQEPGESVWVGEVRCPDANLMRYRRTTLNDVTVYLTEEDIELLRT